MRRGHKREIRMLRAIVVDSLEAVFVYLSHVCIRYRVDCWDSCLIAVGVLDRTASLRRRRSDFRRWRLDLNALAN